MRLLQLRLRGFRSHREAVQIDFEKGVNVFLGSNEAGKTGILLGIQTALFMPRYASEREALVAEGETECSLGLDYELPDGARWRIERDVARNRSSVLQWVEGRWEPLASAAGDIAAVVRRHTGCDEQLFKASLLIRHEEIEVADSSDITRALSERLEVLVAGSAGGVSAAKAVTRLQQAISKLTGPRAGQIFTAEQSLLEGRRRLAQANDASGRIANGRPRIEQLAAEAAAFEVEREERTAVVERARALRDLDSRAEDLRRTRSAIDRSLDARAEFQRLEVEAADGRARLPAEATVATPASSWAGPAFIGGIAVALGALVLAYFQPLLGIPLFALAVAAAIAAHVAGRRPVSLPVEPAIAELEKSARAAERRRDEAAGAVRALDSRPEAELLADRAGLGRDLQEVETEIARQSIFRVDPAELERAAARSRELPRLIQKVAEDRIRLEVELKNLESATGSVAELEDEVSIRQQDLDRLRFRAQAMALARQELEGAIADIRQGVGPEIAAAACLRLQAIVPEYGVRLEGESGLSFRPGWADGREFERRELSDGTADQFYFAVRAALAEVLLHGVNPPLLLDDPFRYCDLQRRTALHRVLGEIGLERQVLYFTIEEPMGLPVTHPLPMLRVRSA